MHCSGPVVDMVECGQVSTTHAESARNSKPASLRALDACAPIFTNNDDHDEDNNGDHLIRGRRITMVMIMSLRFLDACSLIFTTDNATIATICRAPLISLTSSYQTIEASMEWETPCLWNWKFTIFSTGMLELLCRTASQKSKRLVDSLCSDLDISQSPHNWHFTPGSREMTNLLQSCQNKKGDQPITGLSK